MTAVERSVEVAAPAAVVFAFLTDPERATEWQGSLRSVRVSPPGPLAPGTRIVETRSLLGRTADSTVEVTEVEPPSRFGGTAVAGPVRWRFLHTLAHADGTTTVRSRLEADTAFLRGPAQLLAVRAVGRQLAADLARLKAAVEEGAG